MERIQPTSKFRFALALTGLLGASSLAFAATAPAAPAGTTPAPSPAATKTKCVPDPNAICYQIYAPVTCSNGQTYTNQCYADAACATGCHPV